MRRLILGLMITAPALAGCGHSATLTRARQVAACEAAHQMSSAHQVTIHPTQWTAGVPSPEGSTLVQVCAWPPISGADPDGYLRITADTVTGPGQAEYTGDTLLDNVHGPCVRYRLTYAQGYQGAHQTIVERVRAGV
jgi:hypothetical protein